MGKKNKKIKIQESILTLIKYGSLAIFVIIGLGYVYFFQGGNQSYYLILATLFAIYMLLNIGANDIANNMGPAVGAKAITLGKALILAAIFEALGAIIAGGDVVDTIKSGIINSGDIGSGKELIVIMLSTLLGAAIWINLATFLRAPVSTTNSVIGGLIGAGIASAGLGIVKWIKVGEIAGSWVISVVLGGVISVLIYQSIRKLILKTNHKGKAAKHWVPYYVGIIGGIFTIYLLLKGFKPLLESNEFLSSIISPFSAIIFGVILGLTCFVLVRYNFKLHKKSYFEDDKKFVNKLFNIPLIVAVSLLSFAHGSNDVANAVGPLAAIYETISGAGGNLVKSVGVPLWIMIIGGVGLSMGLAIFGARLIEAVGKDITKIDQVRAFSIAMSTASTVLLASALGLPVSSTQIALGAIFGIGLFRKYLSIKRGEEKEIINLSMMRSIILSWVVTLPATGIISALTYIILIKF